ncbi:MAG: hypothetical protein ACREMB_22720 [Candidatus Rokuibacteriota bacterium]
MRHLTIRTLPVELGKALEREKRRRATSLHSTVIDLLSQSLGVRPGGRHKTVSRASPALGRRKNTLGSRRPSPTWSG